MGKYNTFWAARGWWWGQPTTRAEKTIYWFIAGKRWSIVPTHYNCRVGGAFYL